MSKPIEDYALLSNGHSAALVSKEGSIDWLTLPHFDSGACFASLLGDKENGMWKIAPSKDFRVSRQYAGDSLVLETTFVTDSGSAKILDALIMHEGHPTLIRVVEGLKGNVKLNLELYIRFDYGTIVPWVVKNETTHGLHALAGPDGLVLYSPVKLEGQNLHTVAQFEVGAGEEKTFTLMWYPSHLKPPELKTDPCKLLHATIKEWEHWIGRCSYKGFGETSVRRSLLTLKSLIFEPTGAIVAAPTTSLPEVLRGERNWDYRFSWLRDSSFCLLALLQGNYVREANQWQEWLHRAVAGTPSQVNIMYGIRGERRLTEFEISWLKGYEGSTPVRIGNAAHTQFQLDVYGEILSMASVGWAHGLKLTSSQWEIHLKLVEFVCDHWNEPDEGIWEIRGPRQHFTHSKLMAWVALSCAIEAVQKFHVKGDVHKWIRIRDQIKKDICEKGFNKKLNSFVQYFGGNELDASVLIMGHTNFLSADDPRMIGTVRAIQKNLARNGHVHRYNSTSGIDGLSGTESSFIACSFWLVDNLLRMGKKEEALEHYKAITAVKNDVGLYAEEFSVSQGRMLGNFPQAFSHIAEVVTSMGFENIQ